MDKKIKFSYFVFIIFIFVILSPKDLFSANISSPTPVSNQISISPMPLSSEIDKLRADLEKLRDENYKSALSAAENAAGHADRLILWITGIATIYGVLLTALSIIVGGDLYRKLKELGGYVKTAKKNSLLIAGLSEQAQKKRGELDDLVIKIEKYKQELEKTKGETSEQREEISSLLNRAQGTISEIEALKNSASFISGATVSPGGITRSASDISWYGASESEKCSFCGKPLSLLEGIFNKVGNISPVVDTGITSKICNACQQKGNGY